MFTEDTYNQRKIRTLERERENIKKNQKVSYWSHGVPDQCGEHDLQLE